MFLSAGCRHSPGPVATGDTLNTGKDLRRFLGDTTPLGGFPIGLVPAGDGKFAVICGMGYRQSIYSVATTDGHLCGKVDYLSKAPPPSESDTPEVVPESARKVKSNGVYFGVAVSGNTVYAAQGAHNSISVLTLGSDGALTNTGSIATKAGDFPAGLAIDKRKLLYVSNNSAADKAAGYATPASVAIYDLTSQSEIGRYTFDSPTHTSNYPLAIGVLSDGSKTYCASERDGCVYVLNTVHPAHPTQIKAIATGSHPAGMVFNQAQSLLFVANSLSDTLSVINTASDTVVQTVLLRPGSSRGVPGVTPTSVALSPDEKRIYVTLSDMNAVGVVDAASLTLTGMIPVGWYPDAVMETPDHRLMVVNAKGTRTRNPNPKNNVMDRKIGKTFNILNVVQGNLLSIPVPSVPQLADLTDAVIADNHLDDASRQTDNPLADIGLKSGNIKHVIYIIKENRTYDQVLGDDARGNGDPSIVLFGKNVTPNEHAIADRFVLLDNFYACGEVSGDGWTWSTQGMDDAYVNRNIPYYYSLRGRTYDFEGQNNGYITGGFPANDPDGKALSQSPKFKNGAPAIPNVASTNIHIWDRAHEAGISYRNYGMFLSLKTANDLNPDMPAGYPTVAGLQPPGHDLAGITDIDFPGFDLDYPDSDAPNFYFDQTHDKNCTYKLGKYGKYDAPNRFSEWNREFGEMLKQDPSGSGVPTLMLLRFPHDHTQGMSGRKHSPVSEVADNDYSIGQIVQAVSHSPIWKSTAIFIVEDDAQNGPDHVDAHRTTAYIASPWIKQGSIDHRFNNTDTLLKTMELILGMKPMSQYDSIALPIMDWNTSPANAEPFTATLPSKDLIAQMNPSRREAASAGSVDSMVAASDQMDFIHPDSAPADELNQIIWKSVKGIASPMPTPRNSLISPAREGTKPTKKDDDDDD